MLCFLWELLYNYYLNLKKNKKDFFLFPPYFASSELFHFQFPFSIPFFQQATTKIHEQRPKKAKESGGGREDSLLLARAHGLKNLTRIYTRTSYF